MPQNTKVTSLSELAARIPDGASVAIGGSFLHRGPFAFVRELIRQGRKGLEIIKQSPGYDLDLLCRAGCVAKARAGIGQWTGELVATFGLIVRIIGVVRQRIEWIAPAVALYIVAAYWFTSSTSFAIVEQSYEPAAIAEEAAAASETQ